MPKVSVIVPVYNAENTITDCAANLVHQTLDDIEIIFVNDCSTDNSLQILLDCENQFPDKVIVVNLTENLGPGGARNIGISYASGDYLGFCDSDDLADTGMYEKCLKTATESDSDIVDVAYYSEEAKKPVLSTPDSLTGELDDDKRCELISLGGYLCTKLIKRELYDGITYREHVGLEDMEVLMLITMRARKISTIKEVLYKYTFTPKSASKPVNPEKYQINISEAMKAVGEAMNNLPNYNNIAPAVEYSILFLYQCGLVNAITSKRPEYVAKLKQLKKLYVKGDPRDNKYVNNKMNEADIKLVTET